MAREYICDECGARMNGDRATDDYHHSSITLDFKNERRQLEIVVKGPDPKYACLDPGNFNKRHDFCWLCLAKLLNLATEHAREQAKKIVGDEIDSMDVLGGGDVADAEKSEIDEDDE